MLIYLHCKLREMQAQTHSTLTVYKSVNKQRETESRHYMNTMYTAVNVLGCDLQGNLAAVCQHCVQFHQQFATQLTHRRQDLELGPPTVTCSWQWDSKTPAPSTSHIHISSTLETVTGRSAFVIITTENLDGFEELFIRGNRNE